VFGSPSIAPFGGYSGRQDEAVAEIAFNAKFSGGSASTDDTTKIATDATRN